MELVNTLQWIGENFELLGYGLLSLIAAPLVISGLIKLLVAVISTR